MRIIPGIDRNEGYKGNVHDTCSECRGVVCGFVHKGEHPCDCGEVDPPHSPDFVLDRPDA